MMSNSFDFFTRKFGYVYLKFTEYIVNSIVYVYSLLYKTKKINKNYKSIAAFWYYPSDITGSNLRMGGWADYFRKDGYVYDNFFDGKFSEYVRNIEKGNWTQRYFFFAKCLWRRLPQILQAHKYDVLWIDRGLIPFYPRKSAFLEKRLKKVVGKLVVDTTDGGDYKGNPKLMEEVLSTAHEITVGYKHLLDFYKDRFKVTQVFWTIPMDNYIRKQNYDFAEGKPVIGWMGSPGNFSYVLGLANLLKELSLKRDFIFRYICRENFNEQLEGIQAEHFYFGEDYYKVLSSFDIGISPFLKIDLQSQGKIAMKHQEFMIMGIPQVCSPVAISELVQNGRDVLIAENEKEWTDYLDRLMQDVQLRKTLGNNARQLFEEYYTYPGQYLILKNVLTR